MNPESSATGRPSKQALDHLREQLVFAAERQNRRRRRATRTLVAALGAVLVSIVALVVSPSIAQARVLEINSSAGTLAVKLIAPGASADEVRRELAEAGMQATVEEVPVHASQVGSFVAVQSSGGTSPVIEPVDEKNGVFTEFSVSLRAEDEAILFVGRAAAADEAYARTVSAFTLGLFTCQDYLAPESQLDSRIRAEVDSIRWQTYSAGGVVTTDGNAVADERVVDVTFTSADDAIVSLLPDDPAIPYAPPSHNCGASAPMQTIQR